MNLFFKKVFVRKKMNFFWYVVFFLICLRIFFFITQVDSFYFQDESEYVDCVNKIVLNYFENPFSLCSNAVVPLFNFYPAFFLHNFVNFFYHLPVSFSLRLTSMLMSFGVIFIAGLLIMKKFSTPVFLFSLLALGTNPALIQFSLTYWININIVLFTLIAFLIYCKLFKKENVILVVIFSFFIVLIFQSYVVGKVIALGLFVLSIIEFNKYKHKAIFLGTTLLLSFPIIIQMFGNPLLVSDRISAVVLYPGDITINTFFFEQILPTMLGVIGVPYTVTVGPDNPFYVPASIGIMPFYLSPLLLVGYLYYFKKIIYCIKNNSISKDLLFWMIILIIVIGVNLFTKYPLNVSRSLLLIPISIFVAGRGLTIILGYKIFHFRLMKILLITFLLYGIALSIFLYYDWLSYEFYYRMTIIKFSLFDL